MSAYLAIVGPNMFAPMVSHVKKQSVVSHSSTECGVIRLDEAVRTEGLQILTFWGVVVSILSANAVRKSVFALRISEPIYKQTFYMSLGANSMKLYECI